MVTNFSLEEWQDIAEHETCGSRVHDILNDWEVQQSALLAVCEAIAASPLEAQEIMHREGFVIDDLGDRWQKFAFTLYTMLVGNAVQAEAAIDEVKLESTNCL